MTTEPLNLHLCFSTHWDREWIQTFEEYRFRLVRLFDRLLEILENEPAIRFFFDGQTVVLEDYLEIRPGQVARIKALAEAGRLVFGPWYVLADQFLECDEATVRNLLTGRRIAALHGGAMLHGYNPDSFGSIATMPMILSGFGISSANIGRGSVGPDSDESLFWWAWKDGSKVLAAREGYGNAVSVSYPEIWKDIEQHPPTRETVSRELQDFLCCQRRRFVGSHLYASAGIDHMEMRPGLERLIEQSLADMPGVTIVYSTPEEFLSAARAEILASHAVLPTLIREMRGDSRSPMDLQGVLSTDVTLKQTNRRTEISLSRLAEQLEVWLRSLGGRDESDVLRWAWKMLLRSHAHDSICACSIDEVMEDIHARFARLENLLTITTERWMADGDALLTAKHGVVPDPSLWLLNTLPLRGSVPFQGLVSVPWRLEGTDWHLVDAAGGVVGEARWQGVRRKDLETCHAPTHRLARVYHKAPPGLPDDSGGNPVPDPDGSDLAKEDCYTLMNVRGVASLGDAAGTHVLTLRRGRAARADDLEVDARFIRNRHFEVEVSDAGLVSIEHPATGRAWHGLGQFEDRADAGDTYDFNPLEGDIPLVSGGAVQWRTNSLSSTAVELETFTELDLPAELAEGAARNRPKSELHGVAWRRGSRSGRLVRHRIRTTYTLHAQVNWVQVKVEFENQSLHHRLRMIFPCDPSSRVESGGHFAILPREWHSGRQLFPTFPFTDFLYVEPPSGRGWVAAARGLYEAEAEATEQGHRLYVTLVRSVDTLGAAAGMNQNVEHSKMLGVISAEFFLAPANSAGEAATVAARALTPLFAQGLRANAQGEDWFKIGGRDVVYSCVKRSEAGDGSILRFYNAGGDETSAEIEWHFAFSDVSRCELDESPSHKTGPQREQGRIRQALGPAEVVSLKFHDTP